MNRSVVADSSVVAILGLCLAAPAYADTFPPVTAGERALRDVPGQPGAPAVVLFRKAELKLMDLATDPSSSLEVHERIKILTEEGKEHGTIEVPHRAFVRLEELVGRTVLPDGSEVALPEGSVVDERRSGGRESLVVKAAFAAVEVGAVVDVRYTLSWDHPYYFEPWYFHDKIPTMLSQITYDVPGNMAVQSWYRETAGKIRTETKKTERGERLRVWMEDLTAIPDEPYAFPFSDLSARFMAVPTEVTVDGTRWPLLGSWESVCAAFEESYYGPVRGRREGVARMAKALAGKAGTAKGKALPVYAFVRDEVETVGPGGVFVDAGANLDQVLADRRGTAAEKALLLQTMLESLGLPARLVWVGDRSVGKLDLAVANPSWFEKMIVRLELGSRVVFLDPDDRRLGFARLSPWVEGTEALVVHETAPEVITLPKNDFDDNLRRAELRLEVDEEGRVSGSGSLQLTGHHAWTRLRWHDSAEATSEAWNEWLEHTFDGYVANVLAVEESLDEQRIRVSWFLSQREEMVSTQVGFRPCLPLGPVEQPFTLAPGERRTPVLLPFADRNEVDLRISWDEDLQPAFVPENAELDAGLGALAVAAEVNEIYRRIEFRRRFEIRGAELGGRPNYEALRGLFARMVESDAQELVLVER